MEYLDSNSVATFTQVPVLTEHPLTPLGKTKTAASIAADMLHRFATFVSALEEVSSIDSFHTGMKKGRPELFWVEANLRDGVEPALVKRRVRLLMDESGARITIPGDATVTLESPESLCNSLANLVERGTRSVSQRLTGPSSEPFTR